MANAEDFRDFVGGTLVEYLMGHEYSREFSRVNIVAVEIESKNQIEFKTDGEAHYATSIFQQVQMKERDGVFYFDPPYLDFCYAIAPKGVVIPKPNERMFEL